MARGSTLTGIKNVSASIAAVLNARSAAPRSNVPLQVLIVTLCVGIATLIRWLAGLIAPELISYSTFLPAIAVAALFAGAWAGLATLVLSLAVNFLLFVKAEALATSPRTAIVAAILFTLAGLVQLGLAVLLRQTLWQVRRSETRHRALLQSLTEIVWEADASGGGVARQPAWEALTGMKWPDYNGFGWLKAVHPDDRARVIPQPHAMVGQPHFVADARIRDHRNNEWRWFRIRALPLYGDDGKVERWIGSLDDIHDEHVALERREMQMGELRHRLKNLIAVIQALITYSQPKDEPKVEEFAKKFMARLHALGASGDLVIASNLQDVEIGEAIRASLKPFLNETKARLSFEGPPLRLQEPTAAGIALAVHELATNALKYGALSAPDGSAKVAWHVRPIENGEQFELEWREVGGPPAHQPNREGFGMRLVRMAVAREKDANVAIEFAPTGLVCRMTFMRSAPAQLART